MAQNNTYEFAWLTLRQDANLSTDASAAKVWHDLVTGTLNQPGALSAFWGVQEANSLQLQLLVEWASHQNQLAYTKKPEFGLRVQRLTSILDGSPGLTHLPVKSEMAKALRSPLTIITLLHFESRDIAGAQSCFVTAIAEIMAQLPALGLTHGSYGWTSEQAMTRSIELSGSTLIVLSGSQSFGAFKEGADHYHALLRPLMEVRGFHASETFQVQFRELSKPNTWS